MHLNYPKGEFQSAFELPDLNQFAGEAPGLLELPYNKLRKWVSAQMQVPAGQTLAPGGFAILPEVKEKMDALTDAWFTKFYSDDQDESTKARNLLWIDLTYAPAVVTPTEWAAPTHAYVRNDPFMSLPSCNKGCGGCKS